MIYIILNSWQVESDQFCWGGRSTKLLLKVNPRIITEAWQSVDDPVL